MPNKDTHTMQNIVARLDKQLVLDCENPNHLVKSKFKNVKKAFIDLAFWLDETNDAIEAMKSKSDEQ